MDRLHSDLKNISYDWHELLQKRVESRSENVHLQISVFVTYTLSHYPYNYGTLPPPNLLPLP